MMKFVSAANLPSGKVSKIICGTTDSDIISFFLSLDIDVLSITENKSIDIPVSTHADMAAIHLGGNKIIVDKLQQSLREALEKDGFEIFETSSPIAGRYPDDIRLNFALAGDFVIGNVRYADKILTSLLTDKIQVNVRQGYCKCSTLIVDEKSIITDDESIFSETLKNGFDVLLISKGDIALDGYDYGFIGGASGKISDDTVVFFGDITKHRDYDKINSFLSEHGCKFICSDNKHLRDIGGIIPLIQA